MHCSLDALLLRNLISRALFASAESTFSSRGSQFIGEEVLNMFIRGLIEFGMLIACENHVEKQRPEDIRELIAFVKKRSNWIRATVSSKKKSEMDRTALCIN